MATAIGATLHWDLKAKLHNYSRMPHSYKRARTVNMTGQLKFSQWQ